MSSQFSLPDISGFSPEEQNALMYHRRNLLGNTALKHDDGSLTTFYGTVVETPKGAMVLPTYWGGAIREVPDAMRWAARSGIQFPTYKDVDSALAAEKRMHDIMEQDLQLYRKGK